MRMDGAVVWCFLSETHRLLWVFASRGLLHFAYLDEFGHIGPYISADDPKFNSSPVFGLGGLILPASEVRGFSTRFFQRKCELLGFEIKRSGKHPAEWEKKGSAPLTTRNMHAYPELRRMTNRLLNKIENVDGRLFYVGIEKTASLEDHDPQRLYRAVLRENGRRNFSASASRTSKSGVGSEQIVSRNEQRAANKAASNDS